MLRLIIGVFFTLLTANLVESQSWYDDPCHMVAFFSQTEVQEVIIPADCLTGDFDWHYPRGSLRIVVEPSDPNQPFTTCIEESWAIMIGGISDVTSGMDQSLPLPTTGQPSCTRSHTGQAEVLISAESTLYYMTRFRYRINTN